MNGTPLRNVRIWVRWPRWFRHVNPIVYLVFAGFLVNVIFQPTILSLSLLGFQIQSTLPLVFVAFAQTLVILSGGFDLSVGGILVITNVLTATLLGGTSGTHLWLLPGILVVGLGLGAINGVLVAWVKLQPFIATLGTWAVYDGIALTILKTDGGNVPTALTSVVNGTIGALPVSYLILAGVVLLAVYVHRHPFGLYLKATGADEENARRSGINTAAVRFATYSLSGLLCGLAGLYLAAQTGTGTPTAGDSFILQSVEAVAIGGASLLGGQGNIVATIGAVFVLTFISNIVFALNLQPYIAVIASSALLLAAVALKSARGLYQGAEL